jgi:hypothetical protein
MKSQITIRKGAAFNDVTIVTPKGKTLYFDLSTMTRPERSKFHSQFMAAYRKENPMRPRTVEARA